MPAISLTTSVAPGNPANKQAARSHRHKYTAAIGTSTGNYPSPPAHQNPAGQAQDAHQAVKTADKHHATTSANTPTNLMTKGPEVKRQAKATQASPAFFRSK
ncbi:hypothetical protein GCM10023317_26120 [Actinopolymorpha pittospori]